jgi:hypothetical protein
MRSTKSLGLVIALIAIACGSDIDLCGKVNSAINGFTTKATPCYPTNPPTFPFTAAQCTLGLVRCTDADKRIITNFADCLNALPTCTVPTAQTWATQASACGASLNTVSAACRGA